RDSRTLPGPGSDGIGPRSRDTGHDRTTFRGRRPGADQELPRTTRTTTIPMTARTCLCDCQERPAPQHLGTRQGHRSGHAARSPVYGPIGLSGRGYGPGRLVRFTTQDRGIGRMPRPPRAFFVVLIRAPVPVSARPRGCATPILRDADTGPRRGCSYRDRVASTSPVQVTLRSREVEDLVEAENALCLAQVAEA